LGPFRSYDRGTDNLIAWGFSPNSLFTEVDSIGKVLLKVAFPTGVSAYRTVKVPLSQFDADLLHRTAGLPTASFPLPPRGLSIGAASSTRTDRTSLAITRSGFTDATAVKFGSANASSLSVASDVLITAVAPPGSGSVAVTVTTPGGTSTSRALNMLEGSDSAFAAGIGSWTPNVNATVALSHDPFRSRPFSLEVKPKR